MRNIFIVIAFVCASSVGIAMAVWKVTQPVGFVSATFCKNPEKPCRSYSFEVKHEAIAFASQP